MLAGDVLCAGVVLGGSSTAQSTESATSRGRLSRCVHLEPFGQTRDLVTPLGAGDRGAREVVADRLVATAQLFGQECFGHRVEGQVVFRPRETVAFIGKQDI